MTKWKTALMSRRVKPIVAWRAMRRLLADPDDTTQVFNIIEALKGDSLSKATQRLRTTEGGRRLLQNRPDIVSVLNDRAWLLSLPEGSVGRTYYDFVHG